jgi:hypothetical protein
MAHDKIYYTPDKFIVRYPDDSRSYRRVLEDNGIEIINPVKIYYSNQNHCSYINYTKEQYDAYWKKYYLLKALKELK